MSNEHVLYSINSMTLYIILNLRNPKTENWKYLIAKLLLIKNMQIIYCNLLTYIDKRPTNSLNIVCELNVFSKVTQFIDFKQNRILFIYSRATGFNRFKMKLTFSKHNIPYVMDMSLMSKIMSVCRSTRVYLLILIFT